MGGACGARGTEAKCIYVLIGKPKGRRPTGRHKHRWEGDIKVNLKKYDGRKWTGLIWLKTGTSGWVL